MAQHGITLPADSLDASSAGPTDGQQACAWPRSRWTTHPDPAQFVKEFAAEDSAVASYLVDEVLNAQPAGLRTFCCERASLTGQRGPRRRAGRCRARHRLARPGPGERVRPAARARVVPLPFAVRRGVAPEAPARTPRPGSGLAPASGPVVPAETARSPKPCGMPESQVTGSFAARIAVDELAIGQLIEPPGRPSLADGFRCMPEDVTWAKPQPLLVAAALELSATEGVPSSTALDAAESILERLPADDEIPARLAAALIRLAVSRRTGDLDAATAAAAPAEGLLAAIPGGPRPASRDSRPGAVGSRRRGILGRLSR